MSAVEPNMLSLSEVAFPSLQGIDYVELYVGNPLQAAHYYQSTFGFTLVAYAGLETGMRDRVSYVLQSDQCFFVLTGTLQQGNVIADYIDLHGDGVKDIAFRVEDAEAAYASAMQNGAESVAEPMVLKDETGYVIKASILAFGDTVHSFIQRKNFSGVFLPAFERRQASLRVRSTGLHKVDHFAVALPQGTLQEQANFYKHIFGFQQIHEEGVATESSSMNSIAVQNSSEEIKFVLMEPVARKRTSQIEEFIKYHLGAGVQHIALHTEDMVKTIDALQENGVHFVSAPASYYEMLPERVGSINEDLEALRRTNILVDRDEWGYLLQIFSLPVQNRPTLFIEVIQRKAARGFGSGNIVALFKALEREQARRGNL